MAWIFTDETCFYLHQGESLLDGLIRTQHKHVRFECCKGYCGSCRIYCSVITGTIELCQPMIASLSDDEVLACCCVPTGSVAVSYDLKALHNIKVDK